MDKHTSFKHWPPALAAILLLSAGAAPASVLMEGEVSLDYYIAEVDAEGFELPELDFYVERVVNESSERSGPLSLAGWFTADPSASGAGTEAGVLPIGSLPSGSALEVWETAPAEDVPPGEYYVHTLLQDDRYPGSYEDSRSLSPRLLWRGGLEAIGPLDLYAHGRQLSVDFAELRNNRLDSRYTNDIILTLYATYGFGPASEGHELCSVAVTGLYAGETRHSPGFDCWLNAIPDGEYTVHLMVAEAGGRGGSSTLSGPDLYFHGGYPQPVGDGHSVYYSGAFGGWALLLLVAALVWRRCRVLRARTMR